MNISLLDCTLRDGGYINKWAFKDAHILKILRALLDSQVEIIECGYVSDKGAQSHSTLFSDIATIDRLIDSAINSDIAESTRPDSISQGGNDREAEREAIHSPRAIGQEPRSCDKIIFVAMINLGDYDISKLPKAVDSRLQGIRLAFHKEHLAQALHQAHTIQSLGYKVFFQPMITKRYSDIEFLSMLESVNALNPYAFYIVDSFGSMNLREFERYVLLSDSNLAPHIALGYHSHNNMQLAFSNAIHFTQSNLKRDIILDSSIYGIGRGAGNLNTELIADFLNKEASKAYVITPLLDVIDSLLQSLMARHSWGFSPAQYLSASLEIHPNYANYLTQKNTNHIAMIRKILTKIPESKRSYFDQDLIERLYVETIIESSASAYGDLALPEGKKILLIAPGSSVLDSLPVLNALLESGAYISIALNHKPLIACDYYFFANQKRYDEFAPLLDRAHIITTNNIATPTPPAIVLEYRELVYIEGEFFTNTTAVLLHYLILRGIASVEIAGLDGYQIGSANYCYDEYDTQVYDEAMREQNAIIRNALSKLKDKIAITFLTPSIFKECV